MTRTIATLLILIGLTGCGTSAPVRYYTLTGAGTSADVPQGSAAVLVEVLPVALPERINREEIVLVSSDGHLDLRGGERWAAPLADEFRQILDDALWQRVRATDTYAAPIPPGHTLPQYRLALRIERFDATPGRLATIEGSWTARRLPQGATAVCRARFVTPAGAGTEGAASALVEGAQRLAGAVAASLDAFHGGDATPCEPQPR